MVKRKAVVIESASSSSNHDLQPKKRQQAMEPIVEIDPSGDLVIAIGTVCQLVKVNINLLCAVSPVFKTMLGPSFVEGLTGHDSTNPLRLPEDHPVATANMFRLAHFKSASVTTDDEEWLQQLFVVCDKYKCTMSFRDFFEVQLMRSEQGATRTYSKADSFVMAYLMDDRPRFDNLCETFVAMNQRSLNSTCHKGLFHLLPVAVLDHIRNFRKEVKKEYIQTALDFPLRLKASAPVELWCEKARQAIGVYITMHVETGILSQATEDDVDLVNLYKALESLSSKGLAHTHTISGKIKPPRCVDSRCGACGNSLQAVLRSMLNGVKVGKKGGCKLCFKCFKEGKFGPTVDCAHIG